MRKKPHDKNLKEKPKEQHLNTVLKFCSSLIQIIEKEWH